jgi:hypothetical protein
MRKPRNNDQPAAPVSWPNVRKVVDDGATLQVHGGGHFLDIASLYQEDQLICMFLCKRMRFDEIMDRLDVLAKRYNDEGKATDEVNGSE